MSVLSSGIGLIAVLGFFQVSTPLRYELIEDTRLGERTKPGYQFRAEKDTTVVSVFAGQKPTAGYQIEVLSVTQSGKSCTVKYRVAGPPRDAMVAQMLTYPTAVLRVKGVCSQVKVDPALPLAAADR